MTQPKKKGRKELAPEDKKVNIQCYMIPNEFSKMGRRQAALMARHFICQLNELMKDGEAVSLNQDSFKVVRRES